MKRHQEHVVVAGEADEGETHQRPSCQIEGLPALVLGQPHRFALGRFARQMSQVDHRQWQIERWRDHLQGHAVFGPERRPQRFVAPDDLVDAAVQRLDIHLEGQTHRFEDVVGRRSRNQLFDEPEPLLSGRHRTDERLLGHAAGLVDRSASGSDDARV